MTGLASIINILAMILGLLSTTLLVTRDVGSSEPIHDAHLLVNAATGTFIPIDQGDKIEVQHSVKNLNYKYGNCTAAFIDKPHHRIYTASHCGDDGDRLVQGSREYGTFHKAAHLLNLSTYYLTHDELADIPEDERGSYINTAFDVGYIDIDEGADSVMGNNIYANKVYKGPFKDLLTNEDRLCVHSRKRNGLHSCGIIIALTSRSDPHDIHRLVKKQWFYRKPFNAGDRDIDPDHYNLPYIHTNDALPSVREEYLNNGDAVPLSIKFIARRASDMDNPYTDPILTNQNNWVYGVGADGHINTSFTDPHMIKHSITRKGDSGSGLFNETTGEVIGVTYGSSADGGVEIFAPLGWWMDIVNTHDPR